MIIVNLAGVLLICLIVWWFWLYQPETVAGDAALTIEVANGVYTPAHLTIASGTASVLRFHRVDESPCAEMVIFPELELSAQLQAHAITPVEIPPLETGKYAFHCQMQMYKGTLTVKERSS